MAEAETLTALHYVFGDMPFKVKDMSNGFRLSLGYLTRFRIWHTQIQNGTHLASTIGTDGVRTGDFPSCGCGAGRSQRAGPTRVLTCPPKLG